MQIQDKYVSDVLDGTISAGRMLRLACERHLEDCKNPDLIWNEERAQHACNPYTVINIIFIPSL